MSDKAFFWDVSLIFLALVWIISQIAGKKKRFSWSESSFTGLWHNVPLLISCTRRPRWRIIPVSVFHPNVEAERAKYTSAPRSTARYDALCWERSRIRCSTIYMCSKKIYDKTSKLDSSYVDCLLGAKSDNGVRHCFQSLQNDLEELLASIWALSKTVGRCPDYGSGQRPIVVYLTISGKIKTSPQASILPLCKYQSDINLKTNCLLHTIAQYVNSK